MFVVLVCVNIALLIFSIIMVLYGEDKTKEFNQKLEIQNKLIESLENRLDLHKL